MKFLGAILFFILGMLATGLIIHFLWILFFEISETGDNKVIAFSIPTEVIVYILTIFSLSIAGGILSTIFFLKRCKK